jgi:hypothetical protein
LRAVGEPLEIVPTPGRRRMMDEHDAIASFGTRLVEDPLQSS